LTNGSDTATLPPPASAPAAPASPDAPAPVRTFARKTWLYSLGQSFFRMLAIILFDLRASGVNNVPRRGGVLIVSNHQSFLDPPMLGVKVARPMSFLAKSELFANRIFGALIRGVNAFPVRQGEGDVGAVRETIKRLQEGHVLVMFPEGARCTDGKVAPMQTGVGLIVRLAGPTVKVVPAAILGSFESWPRGQLLPRPMPVRVKYGQPLELSTKKAAEIVKIIDAEIQRLFNELRAEKQADHRTRPS
jgi:1-acyl-sn-glycerol-3-phosphate acyltransferase